MSEKRRDRKNRVLRNGESQRKDGRYMYKYNDANGEVKYFYSWRLDKNDPTPVGKKYGVVPARKSKENGRRQICRNSFRRR